MMQKKIALQKGYEYISWTYDPLETVNGNLNLHKLKAICTVYMENVNGDMTDSMNSGIATDRFLVEWRIKGGTNVDATIHSLEYPYCISTQLEEGYVTPIGTTLELKNDCLLVPVPSNFQSIKKHNFSLALKWRETTREVFNYYLNRGWGVVDLFRDSNTENQYVYVLRKTI